ncbi:hypothetical protein U1Q18_010474, partial [Sarracenia purpurea var. burkii]
MFSSHVTKSKAEKYRVLLSRAFESVIEFPMTIEIGCELHKDVRAGINKPLVLPCTRTAMVARNDTGRKVPKVTDGLTQVQVSPSDPLGLGRSEIVEIASPRELDGNEHKDKNTQHVRRDLDTVWIGDGEASNKKSTIASLPVRGKVGEQNQSQSLVRSKVSLAHVIQQAEGCTQRNKWPKHIAVSIADRLEQENLKLEPRSRSLLCWKASRVTRRK